MENQTVPNYVNIILDTLLEAGFEAFLVGGCVRDTILMRPVKDWDIATSATTSDMKLLFTKTVLTGERFGTVTVVLPEGKAEVTTFRSDGEYKDGRKPETVSFVSDIYTDLARRDFTMNAIAVSRGGEVLDPFDGRADIKNGLTRCVGSPEERFSEDALRMLRAVRFSAELGFDIHTDIREAIKKLAERAALLSAERVRDETVRTLLAPRPEKVGEMLQYGLFAGRIRACDSDGCDFSGISAVRCELKERVAAFCGILKEYGYIDSARRFLTDMRFDGKTVSACAKGAELAEDMAAAGRQPAKRLLAFHGEDAARCAAAAALAVHGADKYALLAEIISSGECVGLSGLAIRGADLTSLGISEGKGVGEVLTALLEHVLENPADNTREKLLDFIGR